MEASFKKLSHVFCQTCLMGQRDREIEVLWFQNHEITFPQKDTQKRAKLMR